MFSGAVTGAPRHTVIIKTARRSGLSASYRRCSIRRYGADHGPLPGDHPRPETAVHLVYSTSPAITIGSDRRSFIGSQLCVLPCISVATTR